MGASKGVKAIRICVSLLFSFLMSLMLIVCTALCIIRYEFMEGRSIDAFLGETYYRAVLKDLVTAAEDYTLPTGISLTVIEGVYEYDDVAKDVRGYIISAFKGEEYEPDLSASSERLKHNLAVFFDTEDVETDGEISDICESYVSNIEGIYKQKARMPGLDIVINARTRYGTLMILGIALLALTSAGTALFLIKLNGPAHNGLNYLSYASGAAAFMSFLAPAVLFFSGKYAKLNIAPEYFYRFVVGSIRHLLMCCFIAAGIWLAVTAVLITVSVLCRRGSERRLQKANNDQEEK